MKLIEISQKDCVGCRLCEMVCSLSHEGECSTTGSRIKVLRDEEFGNNLVSVCLQCADPKCMEACASNAITRDEGTGIVKIDTEACIGCEICIDSCRWAQLPWTQRNLWPSSATSAEATRSA